MRSVLTVFIALLMVGCSGKIVPGKSSRKTTTGVSEKVTAKEYAKQNLPAAKTGKKESLESVKKEALAIVKQKPRKEIQKVAESNATAAPEIVAEEEIVEEAVEEKKPSRFAHSELITSNPYKVTMKTKKFAFSDTGFMNIYDNLINLQVFSMGKVVLDMTVSLKEDDICVGKLCNTKHGFNQTFLTGAYPDTLVENILQSKPILGGKNLKKMSKGFIQKIITPQYAIKYKIWPGNVYFKDAKNNIIIKLRKLPK